MSKLFICLARNTRGALLILAVVLGALLTTQGQAQTPANFNHASTGFNLEGAHARVACESCHRPGLPTKGVPRDCNGCHLQTGVRAGIARPPTHIPTPPAQQCIDCHNQNTFTSAVMKHTGDMAGQCARCHNGLQAPGKNATHFPTTASCDSCHIVANFTTRKAMVHDATSVGRCSTCHNGTIASGKSQRHVPTSEQCDTCHTSTVTWLTAQFLHDPSTVGRCSTCHNSQIARGRPLSHIPTTAQCDSCHTSQVSFSIRTMNHTGLNGQCSTCHSGAYLSQNAQMKPPTHIPTTAQCDTCHKSTTSWATTTFDHSTVPTAGVCSTCHTPGGAGLSKPTNHIPTTAQCDSCHKNFIAFRPATMDHTGTAGQCVTCHSGGYTAARARAKPATHIPTSRSCDACHTNTVVFAPSTMDHTGLNGQCSTCHSGGYLAQNAQMKPITHIATSAQCDTCHTGFITWATAKFDHATVPTAGVCSTCHTPGGKGLSKPTNHIPTTAQCDTCHKSFAAFAPATMNHTGVGQCVTCHNGSYLFAGARRQDPKHIPTTRACDTCHKSTVAFAPATMDHTGLNGQCISCHSGGYLTQNAQAKPLTHIPTTAQCDTCHTGFITWATAKFDHSTVPTAALCSTCHFPGGTGLSKPTTHIPTTAQCDSCHNNFIRFAPALMDHTIGNIVGQCASCHNGAYLFAGAKRQNPTHIPDTRQCDTCHNTKVFKPAPMNHSGTAGKCVSCHNGAYTAVFARAKPLTHIPTGTACDSCHTNTVAFAPSTMNHTGTAGQCSTCHSGAYVAQRAVGKNPATHIPTTAQCDTCHTTSTWAALFNHTTAVPPVAGRCDTCHRTGGASTPKPASPPHVVTTAQCDTCHRSTASWATVTFVHPPTAVGTCSTCHVPGGSGLSKPATHIPTTAQCDTCHRNFVAFKPSGMDHTGTANQCVTCHNGTYTAANARAKPLTHIPTSPPNQACDVCHQSTTAFAPTRMNHGAMGTTLCSTCHSGAYLAQNAQAKPVGHVVTTAQCNVCHTSFTTWKPATFNHTAVPTANVCSTCHTPGGGGKFKPTNHIPTSRQCDSCHKNFVAFAPALMDHTIGTAGTCSTCHNGAYLAQNAQAKHTGHIVTTAQCDACHKGFITWATATFNHATTTPPVAGRCSTCHVAGGSGSFKPANHIPTTAQCDSGCHSNTVFTAFAPAFVNHALPGIAGQCNTCHNGAYLFAGAKAKTATHIPDNRQCDVCHTTTAFKPSKKPMNHTGLVTCKNCHNGAYVVARAKPSNHIPEAQLLGGAAMECSACHKSTTSWTPVGTTNMNHNGSQGNGSGWCKACHASGVSYLGAVSKKSLTHDKSGPTITDCSISGCHRPLGNRGSPYSSW